MLRLTLGLVINIDKLTAFAINYYLPYIFIFLALLATAGTSNLFKSKKIRHAAVVMMISILCIGYYSAFKNLIGDMRPLSIVNPFTTNFFPEKGIEKLRFNIPDPTNTLIVPADPPDLAFVLACETGIFISYFNDRYSTALIKFEKDVFLQKQRHKMVDEFYNDLTKGILRKDILSFFDTDIFLSPSADLVKKLSQLEKITSVQINNKDYFLYKL